MGDAAAIGLYTFAVSLAELAFMVPDSVSTVFYPRVAGMERRDADALAPQVSRFTILVTILAIVALIPAGWIAANYIVPAYVASMAPFLVILPGIAALSISKVLASYITGLGMPLAVARASGANLVINVAANIALIPAFGIVGAALASLVSYVAHAAMLVMIAARLGRRRPIEYVLPTSAEVRRLTAGVAGVMRNVGRSPPA
jgi:O-antigen/teichoic acid export membrane protein